MPACVPPDSLSTRLARRPWFSAAALVAVALTGAFGRTVATQSATPALALVGGTIIDGTGAEPFTGTVVIEGERIVAVGPAVAAPKGATLVDVRGQTVMPGLFDLHTHVEAAPAGGSVDWARQLMAYTYCGVTSVSELGSFSENFEGYRSLPRSGAIVFPRQQLASRLASTKGHGAESGRPTVHTNEVFTPQEADAVMTAILAGPRPDQIKVFTDGWRYGAALDMDNIRADTLEVIVKRAHAAGLPVITHTVTVAQARVAVTAGVDMIGHSIGDHDLDPELVELARAKGVTYVPTLAVYEPKSAPDTSGLLGEVLEPAAKQALARRPTGGGEDEGGSAEVRRHRWQTMRRNVALMRAGGVRIGVGTDAGMGGTYHGWATLRELKLLVEAGLTPFEALVAATGNSAKAVRVDKDRGTLTVGKAADLVVVAGRPDQHIDDIEKIRSVYLGGRLVDRERIKTTIAAAVPYTLTSPAASATIDDFEQATERAPGGQLWVDYTDGGHDRSRLTWTRTPRGSGNHALLAMARLGVKEQAVARLTLPFAGGGLMPVDASAFTGVSFDVRGDGDYRLLLGTRAAVRPLAAGFAGGTEWRRVTVPFAEFKGTAPDGSWTKQLLTLSFELAGPAGARRWIEIDNVAFTK